MGDKRSEDRVHLSYFLNVHERQTQVLLGKVLDITFNGLNILSEAPVEPGTVKQVLVELPDPILGRSRLPLKVECRWCKRDINPSYYSIGFKFDKSAKIDRTLISELIELYEFGIDIQSAFAE